MADSLSLVQHPGMRFRSGPASIRGTLTVARGATLLVSLMTIMGWLTSFADNQPLEELRTAEQIRRLSTQQADRHYPVRLRGVITYFDDKIPTK